jgi:hypothetical protein
MSVTTQVPALTETEFYARLKVFLTQARRMSYVMVCIVALMYVSMTNVVAQPKICTDIHKILIQRQQGHEPKNFYIEYEDREGRAISYQGLDIDGDKINDSVVRDCGSPSYGSCSLSIKLSTGKQLELEESPFFLGRVKSSVYVIVGESSEKEKEKRGKRRIYQITKQAIKLICPHI